MVKYGGEAELESSTKPNSRLKHLTHFKYSDHAPKFGVMWHFVKGRQQK